jgi:hypothetical protein
MKENIYSRSIKILTTLAIASTAGCAKNVTPTVKLEGTRTPTISPVGPDFQATIDALSTTVTQEATAIATQTVIPEKTTTGENVVVGNWDVETFAGATDQMKGWIEALKNLEPVKWPEFPNVDNPQVGFVAADGLEYGMDESIYCQHDQTCDVPVAARHYRIITADYNIPGIDACTGSVEGNGCGIMIINVGEVTANFRNSMVDTGFTVTGRFWNGDKLPEAINGGLSHVGNNMLNLDSTLNPEKSVNAGANCSVVDGCKSVRLAFAIVSGNELLVKGVTTINR